MQSIQLPEYLKEVLVDNVQEIKNVNNQTKKEMIENSLKVEDTR